MGALTVLYDDACGICTRLAAWLDARPGISAAPIDSDVGAVLLRDLAPGERAASVHVVDPSGRRSSGGAALAPLLRRLPGGLVAAAALEAAPALADRGYRLVADRRRALSRLAALDVCRPAARAAADRQRRGGTARSQNDDGTHPSQVRG